MADRADFNSNRRFYRWTNDVAEYLEDMAGRERQAEVGTVAELLEEIESENLYQVLVTVDGRTLKIVLLKMQGYSTKEIAPEVRPSAEEAAENFIASKTACHPAGYWVRDGNPLTHFLQEDNRMAYRVKAYTLREESTESGTRYFISFKDGQGKSHELEVSEQFFMEFRQMERRNRNLF